MTKPEEAGIEAGHIASGWSRRDEVQQRGVSVKRRCWVDVGAAEASPSESFTLLCTSQVAGVRWRSPVAAGVGQGVRKAPCVHAYLLELAGGVQQLCQLSLGRRGHQSFWAESCLRSRTLHFKFCLCSHWLPHCPVVCSS